MAESYPCPSPASEMTLTAHNLRKTYQSIVAIRNASLQIASGETVGLVGENGAGKSTLLRLLAGIELPDSGTIDREGSRCSVVPQYPRMASSLSVRANLMVPWSRGHSTLRPREAEARAKELFAQYRIQIDLDKPAGDLNGTEVRFAAILAALMHQPDVLILDEPTVGLALTDQEHVLKTVQSLRDQGTGILYISHDLAEVCRLCDRVVTISRGTTGEPLCAPVSPAHVAELLFGTFERVAPTGTDTGSDTGTDSAKPRDTPTARSTAEGGGLTMEDVTLQELRSGRTLERISFAAPPGEITAITGVRESGLDLLEEYFSGRCPVHSGAVRVQGERVPARVDPISLRHRHVAYVPSDRFERAAAMEGSIEENATITKRSAVHHRGIRVPAGVREVTSSLLNRFGIHTEWHLPLGSLSGGTIQKLILSRELDTNPQVCILAEPTAGLDLQSQHHLHHILRGVVDRGAAVLIISSSIEAVTTFADSVVVLHGGAVAGRFPANRRDQIARAFAGLSSEEYEELAGGCS